MTKELEIKRIYITGDCKASELNQIKLQILKKYKDKIKVEFDLSPFLNIDYDEKLL